MRKLLLLLIIMASVIASCGSGGNSLKIGDTAITIQECLSATTEDNYDEMTKVSVRKDESKLIEMMSDGKVYIIPKNTTGTIREVKFGKYLFECTVAGHSTRLWVSSGFLK